MITSVDKFLVALIGAVLFAANHFFGVDLALGEGAFNGLVAVLTPVLTYLVPNK